MSAEVTTSDGGYVNRSLGTGGSRWLCPETHAPRHGSDRAMDRMRLTLRGYQQRAERRAALRDWLAARAAVAANSNAPAAVIARAGTLPSQ